MATNKLRKLIGPEAGSKEPEKFVSVPKEVPVLPARDTVLFPHAVLPLTIGRESSIRLVQSLGEEKFLAIVAQRDSRVDDPQPPDLYETGTLAMVHKVIRMPNQSLFIFAEGLRRIRLVNCTQQTPFLRAEIEPLEEIEAARTQEIEALERNIVSAFQQIVAASPNLSDELQAIIMTIEGPGKIADFVAAALAFLTTPQRQELLETLDIAGRLDLLNRH
ncbi:MAG TPA: LON peptidase substrate-binding domain-containing protein, partial [Terriglobia bacterium]